MTVFRVLRSPAGGADGAGGVGMTIGGQYRLESVLGRGTLGTVYRALDTVQGRPVALKLFDDIDPDGDEARRMLADLETATGLLNPHIVPALDAGASEDGRLFVVEPLLEGQSLAQRLADDPIPPMETVRIALEVLVALDALHRHLLNHYAVHPGNIFVVRDAIGFERVLVGGVGQHHALALDLARGRADGDTRARPEYLAPELISGKPRDVRTDIYQLGLVMYAALTGAPPFVGSEPRKVARRHALERPPSPMNKRPEANVPDDLDLVVVRCLEKMARKRYGSAMELTRDLERVARKGAANAGSSSGRFAAVGLSGLHRLPPSSAPAPEPPRRPLTGSLSGEADGSSDDRSPAGSMEEAAPFAAFDAEPPPAGPQTQLDVRQLLSPPPKITQPPQFGESGLGAERKARATPPIASGRTEALADDDDTAHVPATVTAAFGNGEGDNRGQTAAFESGAGVADTRDETAAYAEADPSKTAVSSQTLVDPLFRAPAAVAQAEKDDDRDDTGNHDPGLFPGAALVGTDDGRGVDTAATRAPTDELKATLVGGPRPSKEAAVEADLSERTAVDGGAASKAAAQAVAAADAMQRAQGDARAASWSDGDTAGAGAADGPSEIGAGERDASDDGWSVGAGGAIDDDIERGLPPRSKAPWIIAAIALIGVAAFALTRGPAEAPEPADDVPEKIAINTDPPPADEKAPDAPEKAPDTPEKARPEGPETAALEARARKALAARNWRGSPDALAETLAELRSADPKAPVIDELQTRGSEALLAESQAAVRGKDLQTALDRARKALAVAPDSAPAARQIEEVSRLIAAAAAEKDAAEKAAAEAAEKDAAEKAAAEKAAAEKAAAEKAEREAAASAAARVAARDDREKAAAEKAERDRKARKAAAEQAQAEAATALEAAEAARREQAEAERKKREEAAEAAREKAEAEARAAARSEAKAFLQEGKGHIQGARWAQARRSFEQALERNGQLAAAHAGLGEVAFQEQRFAEAVTHHRRSVQYASKNAGYRVNLGMAYFKLKNWGQAKASWEKAKELDPGNSKAERYLKLVEKKL